MGNILDKKFDEWVCRDDISSRMNIFYGIRDIPYRIVPDMYDPVTGPEKMIKNGFGFCEPKHHLLNAMLKRTGLPVRYCTYSFRWKDTGVDWTPSLEAVACDLPVTYHLASEVLIDGIWITLDATWDPGLKKAGFPVNEWDGYSDTIPAVTPIEKYSHEDTSERSLFLKKETDKYGFSEKRKLAAFSKMFNSWAEAIRKSG